MLYLIGLGLGGPKDITVRGMEAMSQCDILLLESYTSLYTDYEQDLKFEESSSAEAGFTCSREVFNRLQERYKHDLISELSLFVQRRESTPEANSWVPPKIILADRYCIEQAGIYESLAISNNDFDSVEKLTLNHNGALNLAACNRAGRFSNVAVLVIGDPLSATTHADLLLKCHENNIPCQVVHNTSIMTAIGKTGLFLYSFGPSVSVPFFTSTWKPTSFYFKIAENLQRRLHTLCLLDIQVKEPTQTALAKWQPGEPYRAFQPPRWMTIPVAIEQLFHAEAECKLNIATHSTPAIAISRLGSKTERIIFDTLGGLMNKSSSGDAFGPPLHSLIIPAFDALHDTERQVLEKIYGSR
jgi:diphthine synthase